MAVDRDTIRSESDSSRLTRVNALVTSWIGIAGGTSPRADLATTDSVATAAPGGAPSADPRPHPQADPQLEPSDLLAGVRQDAAGFAFTRQLLESLAAAEDPFAAALGLREASRHLPASLPARDRLAVRAGGLASLGLPWVVLPIARRWMRERVSHLILAARTPADTSRESQLSDLRTALSTRAEHGFTTVLRPVGDLVLGPGAAETEISRLIALTAEIGVTHLALDLDRIVSGNDWSFDADVEQIVRLLRPVFEAARDTDTVIVFSPSSYRAARLAPEVVIRGLADANLDSLRAGVQLTAELPESREHLERLIRWSAERTADGGAPLELIIASGTIAAKERIASLQSGLAVPVLDGRVPQAAQWLRLMKLLIETAATSSGAPQVMPVAASDDPHLLAAAVDLASEHNIADRLSLQMRAGATPAWADSLRASGASVRLDLPLTSPQYFSGAIDVLLALASEASEPGSALAASHDLGHFVTVREDEEQIFATALHLAAEPFPASHRVQSRAREWNPSERDSALFYRPATDTERYDTGGLTAAVLGLNRGDNGEMSVEQRGPLLRVPHISESGFANEPATDATVTENRLWLRGLLERAAALRLALSETSTVPRASKAVRIDETTLSSLRAAAETWSAQGAKDRATRLRRLALAAAAARDRLIVELAAEIGAPVEALDTEVNGAIDAARYMAHLTEGLSVRRGAEFRPDALALVVVEANISLAERAEALLAILATGSSMLLLAHPQTLSSTRALIEEWQAAGLPEGLVTIEDLSEETEALVADTRVDRAMVLGSRAAARRLIRHRPDLQVGGRFREHNTTLIAATANHSLSARDAVHSAFAAVAGDPRSARVVIIVGSAARSQRLREQLADAVRAIRVGDTAAPAEGSDPLTFTLGPLAQAPHGPGLRALTELDLGEEWLVQPQALDDSGRLWRPGIRVGLHRDARFWSDAVGMPVIGVMSARTFDEALGIQRELGGGGVAALHCGSASELLPWLEATSAASLVVNRATGPGMVERLPGGGWDRAGMGAMTLAGGPSRLVTLGSWKLRPGSRSSTLHLRGLDPEVQVLIEAAQGTLDYENFDRVRRAALSDALSWRTSLGRVHDSIGLQIECNVLRYWPTAAQIRLAEGGPLAGLIRVLAAAMLVRAPVTVSTGEVLPPEILEVLVGQGIPVSLERDQDWLERIAVETGAGAGIGAGESASTRMEFTASVSALRVRLIGGDRVRTAEWLGGQDRVSVWADPVTMAGPVELLAFLREQSISVSTHRYGLILSPIGLEDWVTDLDSRSAPLV